MPRDRFESLIAKGLPYKQVRKQDLILATDAITLLRREHAATVRAVKELQGPVMGDATQGYRDAIDDVLALLEQRRGRR